MTVSASLIKYSLESDQITSICDAQTLKTIDLFIFLLALHSHYSQGTTKHIAPYTTGEKYKMHTFTIGK